MNLKNKVDENGLLLINIYIGNNSNDNYTT